ncbi:hypothetical protein [Methylocella sp.]|uniref:hypothetical protein n=1 Tax=Methylocella sp. TaxID=1978226 RepID=UPI003784D3C9
MCDLAHERIRINQILTKAAEAFVAEGGAGEAALVDRCVAALEAVYDGSCVEECLRRRAEAFVALHAGRAFVTA